MSSRSRWILAFLLSLSLSVLAVRVAASWRSPGPPPLVFARPNPPHRDGCDLCQRNLPPKATAEKLNLDAAVQVALPELNQDPHKKFSRRLEPTAGRGYNGGGAVLRSR